MKRRSRIVCVLGAGATIPIGGPSTGEITKAVCERLQHVPGSVPGQWDYVDFLGQVARRLNEFLGCNACNFEDILHALETLASFNWGWDDSTVAEYRPRPAAFLSPRDLKWFDRFRLNAGTKDLLRTVVGHVQYSVTRFRAKAEHTWFREFWDDAFCRSDWDLATLNYDDIFERIAGGCEDGYSKQRISSEGSSPFNPASLWESPQIRLLHLHGSILFGYPKAAPISPNGSITDIWKYQGVSEAISSWEGHSIQTSQSNLQVINCPIITGLSKPDKLIDQPYDEYQAILRESLRISSRLLIVGYGFGDVYLNSMLRHAARAHGADRRVVVVTWFSDPSTWHYDPAVSGWPSRGAMEFLSAAMRSIQPLGSSLRYKPTLVSDDKCCRVYLEGTEKALRTKGSEILDFLGS